MIDLKKHPTPQKIYDDFWKKIVENEDGTLNKEQIIKELHDFYWAIQNVPAVYSYVTGNRLSKILYASNTVIALAEEEFEKHAREYLQDELCCRGEEKLAREILGDEFEEPPKIQN